MTISDKIRVYELSRDLKLDNKDILDAAQKLSISVKSHSSSISITDAKKIKNLVTNKNKSTKNIISVNKPSANSPKESKDRIKESINKPSDQLRKEKENKNNQTLLNKPINKAAASNNLTKAKTPVNANKLNAPQIVSKTKISTQANNQRAKNGKQNYQSLSSQQQPQVNSNQAPKRPIQLFEKPINKQQNLQNGLPLLLTQPDYVLYNREL